MLKDRIIVPKTYGAVCKLKTTVIDVEGWNYENRNKIYFQHSMLSVLTLAAFFVEEGRGWRGGQRGGLIREGTLLESWG